MGRNTHPLIFCILLQTLQQRNITLYINEIRWHIICNRRYTSATNNGKAWQMWQRICREPETTKFWVTMFYLSFADIAEVSMNYLKKGGKFSLTNDQIRQGVFFNSSRAFWKSSSSFWKSPVKFLNGYLLPLFPFQRKDRQENEYSHDWHDQTADSSSG